MITRLLQRFCFDHVVWEQDHTCDVLDPVFLIAFEAIPSRLDGLLVRHPCSLNIRCVETVRNHPNSAEFNGISQNYFSAKELDEACKALEVTLYFGTPPVCYTIGVPCAFIPQPDEMHEFAVMFDGVRFELLCDGVVMDRDFPEGAPLHLYPNERQDKFTLEVLSPHVRNLRLSNDLSGVEQHDETYGEEVAPQFYTPGGYNDWPGDVTMETFGGRLHLFYLYDRRHHGSRHGKGAHEFHHISTANLRDWTEHGSVVPVTADWMTIGTGNAFVWNNRLHLAYGLHTKRAREYKDRANQLFRYHLSQFGDTGSFRFNEIGNLTPDGASYVVSEDGLHFTPSGRLIHYTENPTICVQPDNTLTLTHVGFWKSDHLGEWKLIDGSFPPSDTRSFARNCLDCPAYFTVDGWQYLAVGFTGFFGRPADGDAPWLDFVEKGWDPYDGTNVPMYATFPDGRVIECGWSRLHAGSWGGPLLFREMVSLGQGRVGKRWVPETLPVFSRTRAFRGSLEWEAGCGDMLLECTLDTTGGDDAISLLVIPQDGKPAEIRLELAEARAQCAVLDSEEQRFRVKMRTYEELMRQHPEWTWGSMCEYRCRGDGVPFTCRDYAIGKLTGLRDAHLTLRFLIHVDRKSQGCVIDCEIAGRHTLFMRCGTQDAMLQGRPFLPKYISLATRDGNAKMLECVAAVR